MDHRTSSSSCVLALIVGAVLGVVPDAADSQATQKGAGSIVMRVLGAGDNVRFFVDGKQVPARKRNASWYAAQALVEVPVGEHKVEAQFRASGSGNDGEWNRLSTREPVLVTSGSVTRLDADVSKPEDTMRYFFVTTQPRSDAASLTATSSTVAAAGAATGGASVESSADVPPAAAAEVAAVPTITIRGTEVLSDGKTASAATDPLAVPGFDNDVPTVAELPPPPDEIALVQPGRIEVSLLVQSVPPGAEASLDGKVVGNTPLHVKLDPRIDHLLGVARDGCESIVQLLATDAWRTGRSPQALLHLDCK